MNANLKEKLRLGKLQTITVAVDGWGDVELRELTASERMRFTVQFVGSKGAVNMERLATVAVPAMALAMGLESNEHGLLEENPAFVAALLPTVMRMLSNTAEAVDDAKNG